MFGFTGWLLVFLVVFAIFNAEKLPGWQKELEKKLKVGVDAAKEGTQKAKTKINQVKADIESKKKAAETDDAEENTPEEIEEALKFMEGHIKKENKKETKAAAPAAKEKEKTVAAKPAEDAPVDLEKRD